MAAEDADAAEFVAGGDMPTVSPGAATAKLLVKQPGGRVDYEVSCRSQPQYLAKEDFSLAKQI